MVKGPSILRARNEKRVLAFLRQHQTSSRQQMAEALGLSKNTLSLIVDQLLRQGIVLETGVQQNGVGRPRIEVSLVTQVYQAVGVLIRDTHYEMMVTDYVGNELESEIVYLDAKDSDHCLRVLSDHLLRISQSYAGVIGVGVAIPGMVDPYRGYVHSSTHLGWAHVPVADILQASLGDVPILVLNRVKAAALSPAKVVPDFAKSTFYVRIDDGVGGALVIGNEVVQGVSWTAGEIGHLTVKENGPHCICGQRGCLETLVSLPAIEKEMNLKVPDYAFSVSTDSLFDENSEVVRKAWAGVMTEVGGYLGHAMGVIVNLLNPQYIVIDSPYHHDGVFRRALLQSVQDRALVYPLQETSFEFVYSPYSSVLGMTRAVILKFENF